MKHAIDANNPDWAWEYLEQNVGCARPFRDSGYLKHWLSMPNRSLRGEPPHVLLKRRCTREMAQRISLAVCVEAARQNAVAVPLDYEALPDDEAE